MLTQLHLHIHIHTYVAKFIYPLAALVTAHKFASFAFQVSYTFIFVFICCFYDAFLFCCILHTFCISLSFFTLHLFAHRTYTKNTTYIVIVVSPLSSQSSSSSSSLNLFSFENVNDKRDENGCNKLSNNKRIRAHQYRRQQK